MGLDISVYKGLTKVENPILDGDGFPADYDNHFQITQSILEFTEGNWPGRTEGVGVGVYTFADSDGFRAGSYSGYNRWREGLAKMAGHGTPSAVWNAENASGPFVELIDFADNEGVIGPVVSAKLAKDFAEHQSQAEAFDPGGDKYDRKYWLEKYNEWRKAFEMAADGGAVDFH